MCARATEVRDTEPELLFRRCSVGFDFSDRPSTVREAVA